MSLMTLDEAIAHIYGIDDETLALWQRQREVKRLHRALWRLRIQRTLEELAVEYAASLYLSEHQRLTVR